MKKDVQHLAKCIVILALALLVKISLADDSHSPAQKKVVAPVDTLDSLLPLLPSKAEKKKTGTQASHHEADVERRLASGNAEEDLEHYHKLERRLGIDIGLMVPFGDFQKEFANAPLIGLHFTWEAIPPFSFMVSSTRASAFHKNGAAAGKLTVSSINIGTQASFPMSRFMPLIKLEGSFNFNDVSFDSTRVVTAGNDTFVTTVGLNVGLGWDFVVGREVSFGLDATYHYLVPKKITLSNSSMYDLGSSYATCNFRVNF